MYRHGLPCFRPAIVDVVRVAVELEGSTSGLELAEDHSYSNAVQGLGSVGRGTAKASSHKPAR